MALEGIVSFKFQQEGLQWRALMWQDLTGRRPPGKRRGRLGDLDAIAADRKGCPLFGISDQHPQSTGSKPKKHLLKLQELMLKKTALIMERYFAGYQQRSGTLLLARGLRTLL